jgi:hypothetical protein
VYIHKRSRGPAGYVSALALTSPGDIAQQQNTHTHTDRENVERKKKSRKDALTMMVSLSLLLVRSI